MFSPPVSFPPDYDCQVTQAMNNLLGSVLAFPMETQFILELYDLSFWFVCLFVCLFVCFFETGFLCVVLADLELTL